MLLRQAFEQHNAHTFIATVERYLIEATGNLAQAGTRDEIPGRVEALRTLIDEAGFAPVAQRILSVMNAPL